MAAKASLRLEKRSPQTQPTSEPEPTTRPVARIHPALKDNFGYVFAKSAAVYRQRLSQALDPLGLLPPQMGILFILRVSEPLNQLTLGEELGIDKATMVRLIDGLEEKNLVTRESSTEDRRAKLVRITRAGREMAARLEKLRTTLESDFLAPLSESERKQLRTLIAKLNP